MQLPALAHPERVAAPSIRGYLYQTIGIALRWAALPAEELLLCEGDEDAEHYLVDEHGVVREVTQVQFKDVGGTLSARNDEIQETIFNFLRAHKRHSSAGRRTRFVFTTSARRARQQVSGAKGSDGHTTPLGIDVLKSWMTLAESEARQTAESELITALRALVVQAKPAPASDGKATKGERDYAELEAAVAHLDAEPTRWAAFLDAVEWQFDQGDVSQRMKELAQALATDPRTRELPANAMAQRLVVKVLETSAVNEMNLRVLDRAAFEMLATMTTTELAAWASEAKSDRLNAWMKEVGHRLDQLEERSSGHGQRLDDHDERLRRAEDADRDALRRRSARNLTYLSEFGELRLGPATVHIKREVVDAIVAAAVEQSLVIVGDPGAGKSGALAAAVEELQQRGHDVIVLTANTAHAMGDELVDVLEKWDGNCAGVLVVDALDSVRDDERAAALRKTLGDVLRSAGRWRVVATIRTFDLYQGTAIARLFSGSPPSAFADSRFSTVRHVAVGELTGQEIAQLEAVAPRLFEMVTTASTELKKLLRVPFHLWLAARLLDGGLPIDAIASVRTRVELLDLYWSHRVGDHAASKDAREALLREACDRMIAYRSLQCSKVGLDANRLYDLLTADVLREPPSATEAHDDGLVVFSHHVLFDYAVARLWLPHDPTALAERLAVDSQLLIVVRPSLEMALQRWWTHDSTRRSFWDGVLILCGHAGVREIGKLIGPAIAAAEAVAWDEIRPLAEAFAENDSPRQHAADDALSYLVGALVPRPRSGRPIVGAKSGPWAELAEAAATVGRAPPRESARRLLYALTERPAELSSPQVEAAGRAGRELFAAAVAPDGAARWLLVDAIHFVCRTQRSEPDATARLIRSLLTIEFLRESGYVVVPRLAREVEWLFGDPALVEDIYVAAFGTNEESKEQTSFGGIVFGLQSNRRQDYEGGLYSLREAFSEFLRMAPVHATRALVSVLRAYAEREHAPVSGQVIEGTFTLDGQDVPVRTDYSEIWDGREHEDELVMADAWENCVTGLATDPAQEDTVPALFKVCVERNRLAIVWRRWLHIAERTADTPASRLVLPLLASSYVLWAGDTSFRAGECLKKVFSTLSPEHRERIEKAILGTRALEQEADAADRTCARLLGCVEEQALVTVEAKNLLESLRTRDVRVANRPSFSRSRLVRGRDRDTDDWLRVEGAPIDEEPHRTVRASSRSLGVIRASGDATPTLLLDEADKLLVLLASATASEVHPGVLDDAWGEIAQTLQHVSEAEESASDGALRARIAELAMFVSRCPCPRPSIGQERDFHDHPWWASPHARGDVVPVLMWLGRVDGDDRVLTCVEELAADDVPSVRYRVLAHVSELCTTAPELAWRVAERAVVDERARAVLTALVGGTLAPLAALDACRVVQRLGCLLVRVVDGPGASEVRRLAYQLLADLHLEDAEPTAVSLVLECTRRPSSDDAETLLHRLRPLLVMGPVERRDEGADAQRRRAQALLSILTREAAQKLADLRTLRATDASEAAIAEVRAVVGNLQTSAREVFFASGAHDAKEPETTPMDVRVAERFFDETAATIAVLADTGIPAVVHSVVETLEHLLPRNPGRAFHLIARAIESGKDGGYQYDSMAVDLVVKAVTRFLAEHRALLQTNEGLRDALLDVLDVFVRAGWPQAQEITYGLQDIFR